MARLVVVSNRVPLPSERGAKAGGLLWRSRMPCGRARFGSAGAARRVRGPRMTATSACGSITYATIDLDRSRISTSSTYNFSNGALWPLLHFRARPAGLFHAEDHDGYRAVNRQFAAALSRCCGPTT